ARPAQLPPFVTVGARVRSVPPNPAPAKTRRSEKRAAGRLLHRVCPATIQPPASIFCLIDRAGGGYSPPDSHPLPVTPGGAGPFYGRKPPCLLRAARSRSSSSATTASS